MLQGLHVQAQEWGLEPRCGKHRGRPCQQGAFEMTMGALVLEEGTTNSAHPQASIALFGKQGGPFKTGWRLGLAGLGAGLESTTVQDSEEAVRTRRVLSEFSGVLRLDPFRCKFRPFVEAEAGAAASILDERSFDGRGTRTGHDVTGFDAGLHCGWSAGARLRLGASALLVLRYGKRIGPALATHGAHAGADEEVAFSPHRQDVSVGLSLAF